MKTMKLEQRYGGVDALRALKEHLNEAGAVAATSGEMVKASLGDYAFDLGPGADSNLTIPAGVIIDADQLTVGPYLWGEILTDPAAGNWGIFYLNASSDWPEMRVQIRRLQFMPPHTPEKIAATGSGVGEAAEGPNRLALNEAGAVYDAIFAIQAHQPVNPTAPPDDQYNSSLTYDGLRMRAPFPMPQLHRGFANGTLIFKSCRIESPSLCLQSGGGRHMRLFTDNSLFGMRTVGTDLARFTRHVMYCQGSPFKCERTTFVGRGLDGAWTFRSSGSIDYPAAPCLWRGVVIKEGRVELSGGNDTLILECTLQDCMIDHPAMVRVVNSSLKRASFRTVTAARTEIRGDTVWNGGSIKPGPGLTIIDQPIEDVWINHDSRHEATILWLSDAVYKKSHYVGRLMGPWNLILGGKISFDDAAPTRQIASPPSSPGTTTCLPGFSTNGIAP